MDGNPVTCLVGASNQERSIVLDNAKYHKRLPKGTPTVLWAQLKPYVQQNVKPVVVAMAEKEKPAVLFTPPHHSNLQPIETVWAAVKGEVGRQYTAETTFQRTRLWHMS
ncbi:hypothetical protein L914_13773 [Phytophthora nicotianae]|uniref:Tc1-like transposase DDE domain-containing protein n=1 Tax=Phytophthora nicotianae TaxID=4792 RepID=W2MX58_PHYNI|nr:hypothetical protein L914_13773 [Phytophthora nicotianae]